MQLPKFSTYCNNTTAVNAQVFNLGQMCVWFSYQTCVAFRDYRQPELGLVVRENEWGPTTGKHLNAIDNGDKRKRVTGDKFERMLTEALEAPPSDA